MNESRSPKVTEVLPETFCSIVEPKILRNIRKVPPKNHLLVKWCGSGPFAALTLFLQRNKNGTHYHEIKKFSDDSLPQGKSTLNNVAQFFLKLI